MYNTTLRMVNDEAQAEDIMQDAFLSAFKKIDTYVGDVSFGAWLKRIVVNKSLDYLKKNKTEFVEIKDYHSGIIEEDTEKNYNKEDVEKIHNAINKLDEKQRTIVSLYLLEGYDHEEIAEVLDLSYTNARSQYSRAKKKLLQIIHNDE